jgi:hypothetical protein
MVYLPHDVPTPEQCSECSAPFNNAESSKSGLCGECAANASNL